MNLDHAIPARASELLISKICHDLVSPIGAVNNGIEFMAEMGDDGLGDGIGLIEHSAKQASVRLQLFRMCYGAGGSNAMVTGKNIYEAFENYIEDSKVNLDWDLMNDMPDEDLPPGFLKTLLNMMVFGFESLPKGGVIKVTMGDDSMIVTAIGEMLRPKEDSLEAFNGKLPIEDLAPRSVHGFVTKEYANLFGLDISANHTDDDIQFFVKIP